MFATVPQQVALWKEVIGEPSLSDDALFAGLTDESPCVVAYCASALRLHLMVRHRDPPNPEDSPRDPRRSGTRPGSGTKSRAAAAQAAAWREYLAAHARRLYAAVYPGPTNSGAKKCHNLAC